MRTRKSMCCRIPRLNRTNPLHHTLGFLLTTALIERPAQLVINSRLAGGELGRLLQQRDGFAWPLLLKLDLAQVKIGAPESRIQLAGAPQQRYGLIQPVFLHQKSPQKIKRFSVVRIFAKRGGELLFGIRITLADEDLTKLPVCARMSARKLQGLAKPLRSFFKTGALIIGFAKHEIGRSGR